MSEQREFIKFAPNLPAKVFTFEYDTGFKREARTVKKKDGTTFEAKADWQWGCTSDKGVKSMITASKKLNDQLEALKPKGKTLAIKKVQLEGDKYGEYVIEVLNTATVTAPVVAQSAPIVATPVAGAPKKKFNI